MTNNTQKTQTMPVTTARVKIFEIVDAAYYQGMETTLTKNGKEVALVVPLEKKQANWDEYMKRLENFKPFLTDEDVKDYKQVRAGFNKPRFPDW